MKIAHLKSNMNKCININFKFVRQINKKISVILSVLGHSLGSQGTIFNSLEHKCLENYCHTPSVVVVIVDAIHR